MAVDEALAGRVRAFLRQKDGDTDERRMMGALCFMRQGKMCCGVTGDRLMLRLGKQGAAAVLDKPEIQPLEIGGGRKASAFVTVAGDAVGETSKLEAWIEQAIAFTESLPPPERRQRRR